jgi:hypothetical protein
MDTKVLIHKWKSRRLIDGTGPYQTSWEGYDKENLLEIASYNDRELFRSLTLKRAVYRATHTSQLDTILENGIDRIDTLNGSKMFWASPFDYKCVEYGGDRKAIMAYDGSKVSLPTEQERMQPGVEKEFQMSGYQHIFKFLTNPLDALIAVILIEPETLRSDNLD